MKFIPIQRATAAQLVAEQILSRMHEGTLKHGDQLPTERELMQQLGVGRSSVREALQMLATLNLIESTPGAGTFVRQPRTDEIFRPELLGVLIANAAALELIEARQMIEPIAIQLACVRATDADLAAIDQLLADHRAALERSEPVSEYSARFHVLLAQASHNGIVARFMESIIGLLTARGGKISQNPGYAQQELEEHERIVKVVRTRDVAAAGSMMREHIIGSAQTYDTDDPTDLPPVMTTADPARA